MELQAVVKRLFISFAAAAAIVAATGAHKFIADAQTAATPPPPPPKLSSSATPSPTPKPAPSIIPLTGKSKATPTPAPPADSALAKRTTIAGVWEIQVQQSAGVVYTHFKIDQKDNVLTGTYLDKDGKKYPLTGLIDGNNVRVVVSLAGGKTVVFTATEDQFTDMIGLLDDGTPFTAAYRPKFHWADNLTAGPPGTGGGAQGIP